jgi:hypothetical protein
MISRPDAFDIAKRNVPCLENREWYSITEVDTGLPINPHAYTQTGRDIWLVRYSSEDKQSDSRVLRSSMGLAINKADGKIVFHGLITDEG